MRTINDELIEADAAVVRASASLVARVTEADLGRRTPCAEWDLGTLLEHMTAQHRGFAAAAAGRGADPAAWQVTPGPSVVARYADAAEAVIAAFATAGVLDRQFTMPEFSTEQTFGGRLVIGFHLVDYLVHTWDVARSLDLMYQPPADVLTLTLPIVRAVPDDQTRLAPGAAFAPALAVPSGSDPLAEILSLLGRDPGWHRDKMS